LTLPPPKCSPGTSMSDEAEKSGDGCDMGWGLFPTAMHGVVGVRVSSRSASLFPCCLTLVPHHPTPIRTPLPRPLLPAPEAEGILLGGEEGPTTSIPPCSIDVLCTKESTFVEPSQRCVCARGHKYTHACMHTHTHAHRHTDT